MSVFFETLPGHLTPLSSPFLTFLILMILPFVLNPSRNRVLRVLAIPVATALFFLLYRLASSNGTAALWLERLNMPLLPVMTALVLPAMYLPRNRWYALFLVLPALFLVLSVGAVLYAARVAPGASVLVIGAGGVGQFVVQGARIAGASAIVVCDPVEARLDAARAHGATHAVRPDELRDLLRAELPDGADVGFDAVGYPATTETALRSTRDGGAAVIVGLPPQGERLDLDPFELIRKRA